ncbi:MAG: GAF domain-containing protein [Bacteroidetes bacterium]|nr:GAF domain-containing protein [Bacteroidota bacterium]
MLMTEELLRQEVRLVGGLPIIDQMLQVICRTTGMGFAAVAKVTRDRWIACGVRDEIDFGLKAGGELEVKSTICDEIRDSGRAVIIDDVDSDAHFCRHHTPLQYGFKSYISIPIFLKNGEFFGTLCAIDPRPAKLNNPETVGLFTLFAELLSFHISSLHQLSAMKNEQKISSIQIRNYRDELAQYRHLSNHTLQEPLRKIRLFSDLILSSAAQQQPERVRETAFKINRLASDASAIIRDITDFTSLDLSNVSFSQVRLEDAFSNALMPVEQFQGEYPDLEIDLPHAVTGITRLLEQLFRILVRGSVARRDGGGELSIGVASKILAAEEIWGHSFLHPEKQYCRIEYRDNTSAVEYYRSEKMFEITHRRGPRGEGLGLDMEMAQARKIVRLHGGVITPGEGTMLLIILPL